MYENKAISESEYLIAKEKNIVLSNKADINDNINYYLDRVKLELDSLNLSLFKGLKVYTNIDIKLYEKVDSIVKEYNTSEDELSLIILENNSNRVLLTLGGYSYNKSNYNRSLYSKRQIGSTIKTFLYAFALESNISEDTLFKSEKTKK